MTYETYSRIGRQFPTPRSPELRGRVGSAFPQILRCAQRQVPHIAHVISIRSCDGCGEETAEPYRSLQPLFCPLCTIRQSLTEDE